MNRWFAIWLLEDFVLGMGVDYGTKGTLRLWRAKEVFKNGHVLIERGGTRSILTPQEIKSGEKHSAPNLSYPLGLHFGIQELGEVSWWKRRFLELRGSKALRNQ